MTDHWPPCPCAGRYPFDARRVRAQWSALHTVDAEPLPRSKALLQAWALFHAGHFQQAEAAGLAAGHDGLSAANRATAAHAALVEPHEAVRLELFRRVHLRACMHAAVQPRHPNAWYWQGYALAQYAQGIHIARALAQGLGTQVRAALQTALLLAPRHAYAHLALGAFHAAVIDKVGPMIALVTYGASEDAALHHLTQARQLAPAAPAILNGCADALLLLGGPARQDESLHLRQQAAAAQPLDAIDHLWSEQARAALHM